MFNLLEHLQLTNNLTLKLYWKMTKKVFNLWVLKDLSFKHWFSISSKEMLKLICKQIRPVDLKRLLLLKLLLELTMTIRVMIKISMLEKTMMMTMTKVKMMILADNSNKVLIKKKAAKTRKNREKDNKKINDILKVMI